MKIQRIGGPENAQNRWAKPLQVREVMDGVWRFQDLVAWQLAFELTSTVDTICLRPDVRRDPKFHSQLSDAAASGPRNIAEGFGRYFHPDFARSHVSSVSEIEVMNHLIDAHSRGYIDAREYDAADHAARKALRQ